MRLWKELHLSDWKRNKVDNLSTYFSFFHIFLATHLFHCITFDIFFSHTMDYIIFQSIIFIVVGTTLKIMT